MSAVAYFYFDFNDTDKQDHSRLLRSIVAQIFAQYPETPEALLRVYRARCHGQEQPRNVTLLSTFRGMLKQLGECYVILDALDESRH